MLKKSVVEHTLEAALETGADFAELYVEQTKRNHIAMVNGQVETALGIGLRRRHSLVLRQSCHLRLCQ